MNRRIKQLSAIGALWIISLAAWAQGGVLPLHVNYSLSDGDIYGSSFDHKSYVLNATNDLLALGMLFAVCDSFPDRISGNSFPQDFLAAVRLDSLRLKINHRKTSPVGQKDSLFLVLTGTFGGIFPGEDGFYADTVVFSSSYAPGNSYAAAQYLTIPVGVYLPMPLSFSVWMHVKAPAGDTLRVWSGYGYDGLCTEQPGLKKAQQSNFFPNAFAYRKEYGQILPTLNGEDIFFECDTVPGFDTLADGRNYIQNWDMDFFMTITTAGVAENVLDNSPLLYPNPGKGTFQMHESAQYITVYSPSGQEVWRGAPQAASVYLPLPSGFYVLHVQTDAGTRIQKLIITE